MFLCKNKAIIFYRHEATKSYDGSKSYMEVWRVWTQYYSLVNLPFFRHHHANNSSLYEYSLTLGFFTFRFLTIQGLPSFWVENISSVFLFRIIRILCCAARIWTKRRLLMNVWRNNNHDYWCHQHQLYIVLLQTNPLSNICQFWFLKLWISCAWI